MKSPPLIPTSSTGSRLRWLRPGILTIVSMAYLMIVLGAWLTLYWSDRWWLATLLMFSPRWVFALPLGLILPFALFRRSKSLVIVLITALVVGWPLAGFNVPWTQLTSSDPKGTPFRVLTINMHFSKADPVQLEDLVERTLPDIVAIQEWNGYNRTTMRSDPDWHIHANARLFLASRFPIKDVIPLGGDSTGKHASVSRYELDTPVGVVHVFSLHTATNREGISDTIHENQKGPVEINQNSVLRREQSAFVRDKAMECEGPVLIMGDFNTPPESAIFTDEWSGYTNAFTAAGWGWGYTFIGAKTTVRIDHVLASKGWVCTESHVGPDVGSPHRPVIASLIWTGESSTK